VAADAQDERTGSTNRAEVNDEGDDDRCGSEAFSLRDSDVAGVEPGSRLPFSRAHTSRDLHLNRTASDGGSWAIDVRAIDEAGFASRSRSRYRPRRRLILRQT